MSDSMTTTGALIAIGDPDLVAYVAGYAGVPADVSQQCERLWAGVQSTLLDHLREIRDMLAPYGTWKAWCAGHGVDYKGADYQLNHQNWQPVLKTRTASLLEPAAGDDQLKRVLGEAMGRKAAEAEAYLRQQPADAHVYVLERYASGSVADARGMVADFEKAQRLEANRQLVREAATGITQLRQHGPFTTVMCDPPWEYGRTYLGRGPDYQQESDEWILAQLQQADEAGVFAPNCHFYLWITDQRAYEGVDRVIFEALGFRSAGIVIWDKVSIGAGRYFRGQTEQCVFGVRGSLALLRADASNIIHAPRPGPHSAKPDDFYQLVETCSPGPWLDLWGRRERPGWVCWGQSGISSTLAAPAGAEEESAEEESSA